MENIFIALLPPWVETGLQPAFYDKESGTVLQQTSRMYAKVNELIASYNKFAQDLTEQQEEFEDKIDEIVNEYIGKFEELYTYVHDYFDNLDVQAEVNNKLDAMVEAGTLQEIVADYLNSKAVFGFNTVADMKASTNLIDGSYAKTLGYFAINDGGGATYQISETQPVSGYYETLNNGLYATLLLEEKMNLTQFGVDHTSSDVSLKLNSVFELCAENNVEVIIPPHTYTLATLSTKTTSTYNYSYFIKLLTNLKIKGIDKDTSILKVADTALSYTTVFFTDESITDIKLENLTIEQYYASGVNMQNANRSNLKGAFNVYGAVKNVYINNVFFKNCCGVNALGFYTNSASDIIIENCVFDYYHVRDINHYDRSVVYLECSNYIFRNNTVYGNFETLGGVECHGYNGLCDNNLITKCGTTIHVAPRYADEQMSANITVSNNKLFDMGAGISIWHNTYSASTIGCKGVKIINNNIRRSGYVFNQLFWLSVGMHRLEAFPGIRLSMDVSSVDKKFSDLTITGNSIVTEDYADYSQYITVGISLCTGISIAGQSDVNGVIISNNYIEGQPGAGIATGTQTSTNLIRTASNVIITNNTLLNCANGVQSEVPLKAPISLRYGIINNMIIRNNNIIQTDNNFSVWASIYNQTNADSIRTNLYCDHNIIYSVRGGTQYAIISNNLRNIIIDKGATAERPINANAGDQYFDTTLGKTIVYNGSAWVNVDGTALA